ncbi:hypothetical protein GCM10026983_19900 [Gracilibacillus alcaliphilus]
MLFCGRNRKAANVKEMKDREKRVSLHMTDKKGGNPEELSVITEMRDKKAENPEELSVITVILY